MFESRQLVLTCPWCRTPVGNLVYRTWPPRLEVSDLAGSPVADERAGRVLQRIDSDVETLAGVRTDPKDVRDRLAKEAIEVVYELRCSQCGRFWCTAPALAAAARRQRRDGGSFVAVPHV